MTFTPAQRAIALLIDLARQGKIDPWDVQVIEVIDRFLSELDFSGETDPALQRADLPTFGQAFLWASMLVLLKADTLENAQIEEKSESEDLSVVGSVGEKERTSLPLHLEQHIRRRSCPPPPRRRRVTLSELIEQIEKIAAELSIESDARPRYARASSQSRQEAVRAITRLAHDENLTEVAIALEKFLIFKLPEISPGKSDIELDQLLEWWSENDFKCLPPREDAHKSKDRVGVFWALLLLSAQSKVELSQSEFYQDLRIKPLLE